MYLLDKKIISTPSLYLSYYLKENRIEYYDRMSAVRQSGDYEQWIKFFLNGIYISAKSAIETANELILLRDKNIRKIEAANYNKRTFDTMMTIFNYLEAHPIIEISKTANDLSLSYNTVLACVKRFEEIDILHIVKKQRRNKTYKYNDYLDILRAGTELF